MSADRLSTASTALLGTELKRQSEVRPEMIARGREIMADARYPSVEIIRSVAAKIVNSADLSEDNS